jgi:hypothetical protein
MAIETNLKPIACGEARTIRVTVQGTGTIADWSLAYRLARGYDCENKISKTNGHGIEITDEEARKFEITLDAEDTAELDAGGYVWDIWRVDAGQEVRLAYGTLPLERAVPAPAPAV